MQGCFGTWSHGSFLAAEPGVQEPSLVRVSITLPLELPPLLRSSLLCLCNCITSSFLPWIQLWVLVEKILSFFCYETKKISHLKHPSCLQEPCSLCWHPVLPRSTERKDKPNTRKITPNLVIGCWIQLREGKKRQCRHHHSSRLCSTAKSNSRDGKGDSPFYIHRNPAQQWVLYPLTLHGLWLLYS